MIPIDVESLHHFDADASIIVPSSSSAAAAAGHNATDDANTYQRAHAPLDVLSLLLQQKY